MKKYLTKEQRDEVTVQRVSKLPTWARELFNQLQRDKEQAEAKLQKFYDEQTPSHIYIREPLTDRRANIQADVITIEIDGGAIQVSRERGRLRLTGVGIRSSLAIAPHVSNVVSIKLEE